MRPILGVSFLMKYDVHVLTKYLTQKHEWNHKFYLWTTSVPGSNPEARRFQLMTGINLSMAART